MADHEKPKATVFHGGDEKRPGGKRPLGRILKRVGIVAGVTTLVAVSAFIWGIKSGAIRDALVQRENPQGCVYYLNEDGSKVGSYATDANGMVRKGTDIELKTLDKSIQDGILNNRSLSMSFSDKSKPQICISDREYTRNLMLDIASLEAEAGNFVKDYIGKLKSSGLAYKQSAMTALEQAAMMIYMPAGEADGEPLMHTARLKTLMEAIDGVDAVAAGMLLGPQEMWDKGEADGVIDRETLADLRARIRIVDARAQFEYQMQLDIHGQGQGQGQDKKNPKIMVNYTPKTRV